MPLEPAASRRDILWVVGPALGHVSRCLLVARRLREAHGVDSSFFGADRSGFHSKLLSPEFATTHVACNPEQFEYFADAVVAHIDRIRPGLVCFDCTPTPWLLAMPPLAVPTAYLTNYFLTRKDALTYQAEQWHRHGPVWNSIRQARGLTEIEHAQELYECDRVLLADPPRLVPSQPGLPPHHQVVGACSWAPESAPSPEVQSLHDFLAVLLGSTGSRSLPPLVIQRLVDACDAKHVLSVHSSAVYIDGQPIAPGSMVRLDNLAHASLALTHGGAGTTYQALSQGVPLAIWPAHVNHRVLGERIAELDLGVLLDPSDPEPGLQRLSDNYRKYADTAATFAFDLESGPDNAAKALSCML